MSESDLSSSDGGATEAQSGLVIALCEHCGVARLTDLFIIQVLDMGSLIGRGIALDSGHRAEARLCGECGGRKHDLFWTEGGVVARIRPAEDPRTKPFSIPL